MFGSAAVYIIPGTVKGLPRRCAAPRDETRMDDVAFYLKIYPLSPRRASERYRLSLAAGIYTRRSGVKSVQLAERFSVPVGHTA